MIHKPLSSTIPPHDTHGNCCHKKGYRHGSSHHPSTSPDISLLHMSQSSTPGLSSNQIQVTSNGIFGPLDKRQYSTPSPPHSIAREKSSPAVQSSRKKEARTKKYCEINDGHDAMPDKGAPHARVSTHPGPYTPYRDNMPWASYRMLYGIALASATGARAY